MSPGDTSVDRPIRSAAVERRMRAVGIREEDIAERFVRGGGPGGQKINKTSSCVVLRHRPTGIEVRCGRERSLAMNRRLARLELCERVRQMRQESASAMRAAIERIRRQTRRPPARAQQQRLEQKRRRSRQKAERRAPRDEHE